MLLEPAERLFRWAGGVLCDVKNEREMRATFQIFAKALRKSSCASRHVLTSSHTFVHVCIILGDWIETLETGTR
jgi:hypothetical protein